MSMIVFEQTKFRRQHELLAAISIENNFGRTISFKLEKTAQRLCDKKARLELIVTHHFNTRARVLEHSRRVYR